ncbi:MAG: DNA primase [Georgfuchsia sp.]
MIPESFIQELLTRVDIVDVIERYVPLKKAGANYSACCPFHSEKTPSFTVSPSKQFYHCFGCGAHGSAIGFVMQYSGLGFIDAVEDLASHIGMQVPRDAPERHAMEAARKAPLTELMALATKFYRDQLKQSPKAVDYLKGRGLSGEIAARFGLGYAPDDWQGLQKIFPDYDDQALAECGLVIVNEQGRRYDRFRDRIMFPILDQRGNVIGFGGRVISEGEPKYLNSPETPIFEKGRELYGLSQARKAIHEADTVIVVEGYMDVVGLAQLGVENIVASLGTATTGMHVQKLLKQANRVVFCFDRDSAGDRAARRAMENSLEYLVDGKSVEILQMPGNQDPDEFIREHGKEAFQRLVGNATRLSEFMVREIRKNHSLSTAEGRAALILEAKPLLQKIVAPLLRTQIAEEIAGLALLDLTEVQAQCGLKPLARSRPAFSPRGRVAARPLEHILLQVVIQRPEWVVRIPLELLSPEQEETTVLNAIADLIEHGLPTGGAGQMLESFRGRPGETIIAQVLSELALEEPDPATMEVVLGDAVERLRVRGVRSEIESRKKELTPEEWRELLIKKQTGNRPTE